MWMRLLPVLWHLLALFRYGYCRFCATCLIYSKMWVGATAVCMRLLLLLCHLFDLVLSLVAAHNVVEKNLLRLFLAAKTDNGVNLSLSAETQNKQKRCKKKIYNTNLNVKTKNKTNCCAARKPPRKKKQKKT